MKNYVLLNLYGQRLHLRIPGKICRVRREIVRVVRPETGTLRPIFATVRPSPTNSCTDECAGESLGHLGTPSCGMYGLPVNYLLLC